jgi:hypothetical protein
MYFDPLANITEFRLAVPNGLLENPVPAVKTEPSVNIVPDASAVNNL